MTRHRPDEARLAALLEGCRAAPDLFPALQDAMAEAVGFRLFTLMTIDWQAGEAARVWSNMPEDYPVKGRKPLGEMTGWGRHVLDGRQPWIGRTAEDIRWAFFDHALIARLGCESCLNQPVIDGDRVIGTVNMLHEAGWYDEGDAAVAAPFAALLVPAFRAWAEG